MPILTASWFSADSRANRLKDYEVTRNRSSGEYYVGLECVGEIAEQVERVLEPLHCAPRQHNGDRWDYFYRFDGPYEQSLEDMLELLKGVVTLTPCRELQTCLALDFYKAPDNDLPPEQWPNTEVGELVHRGKYGRSTACGRELADQLAEVIAAHPTYGAASATVAVPGTKRVFGERLTRGVALRVEKPCFIAQSLNPNRKPAKEGRESHDLEPFRVNDDIDGQSVIVLDDVFFSGVSLRSVAAAASAAGASSVLGLVAARTVRRG